jgi:hypothetical protein
MLAGWLCPPSSSISSVNAIDLEELSKAMKIPEQVSVACMGVL